YADQKVAPGTTYFYLVSGSNEAGEGGDSAPAQATIPAPPAAPSGFTATVWLGQVSLKWTPVPGATIYRVKRSSAPGGPYTILANLDGSSFLDESVQPATTYHYVVAAAGAAGDGPDAAPVIAAVPAPPPAAPTGLQASAGNSRVTLKWTAVAEATGYVVRRAAGAGGASASVARVTGTTHSDTTVSNGTAYSYTVLATNANGESSPSASASATPLA